jgi:hypothetical protein
MARRPRLALFVGLGLAVALGLAFFVSPHASSSPDGLEKVSIDEGFDDTARDHDLADGPLADYAVRDVDDDQLATGLAGLIGVALCFGVGAAALLAVRAVRNPSALDAGAGPVADGR